MNIVPVKWNKNQTRYDANRQDVAPARTTQRPPLRVLQAQRANDAAHAVREYEASQRAVESKTERLRALRLAKAKTAA